MLLRAVSRKNLKWPFFDVKMRQNGFFFRIPREKLGKKMLWKIFFLGHMGVKYGVKNGPIKKIDHFTKNGPKSSYLSIFHRRKAQNEEN